MQEIVVVGHSYIGQESIIWFKITLFKKKKNHNKKATKKPQKLYLLTFKNLSIYNTYSKQCLGHQVYKIHLIFLMNFYFWVTHGSSRSAPQYHS